MGKERIALNGTLSSLRSTWREKRFYYLCGMPLIAMVVLLYLYPAYKTIQFSFTDYSLLRPSFSYVGLENYVRFFTSGTGQRVLINTFSFTFFTVLGQIVFGLLFAQLINREMRGKGFIRSLLIIPIMIAPVVVGYMWRWLYHDQFGYINYVLTSIGILDSPIGWTSNAAWALPATIFSEVWYGTPFAVLVFLGGLQSLPVDPFEAAMVDGASALQRFRYITMPLLKPVFMALILLRTMISFQAFDLIFVLTFGGPGLRTEVMNSYGYKVAFKQFQFGYGSATTIVSFLALVVLGLVITTIFRPRRRKVQANEQ